jgi:hypothetical protein
MKKVLFVSLLVLVAMGAFTGVAAAQSSQPQPGTLHEYMEVALADKLNLPVSTIESEYDAGKSFYQIALDNGISQADLPAFMLEVRTLALNAAVADGVITQAQADRMLQYGSRGLGIRQGAMQSGTSPCGGTGIPVGTGMQRGGRWH